MYTCTTCMLSNCWVVVFPFHSTSLNSIPESHLALLSILLIFSFSCSRNSLRRECPMVGQAPLSLSLSHSTVLVYMYILILQTCVALSITLHPPPHLSSSSSFSINSQGLFFSHDFLKDPSSLPSDRVFGSSVPPPHGQPHTKSSPVPIKRHSAKGLSPHSSPRLSGSPVSLQLYTAE